MADYHTFTTTRNTEPDFATLVANLKALDASAGVQHTSGTNVYILKKTTTWTGPQITAAQNALEAAPVTSPQLTAQSTVDHWRIATKALVLALVDQLNVIRAALPTPKPDITAAAAIQAIRDKAATL